MPAIAGESFRLFLHAELQKRKDRNPSYNLSSFARSLGTDVSTLSKILRGIRPLRKKAIQKLGLKLGLNPVQISQHQTPSAAPAEYMQLSVDEFKLISDWHHYALLELMRLPKFRGEPPWISKALHISISEVQVAIERLQRLKMIEIDEDGNWKDLSGGYSTTLGNDFTTQAFKKFQKQILEKASLALDETPYEERSQTSMTMAIDRKKISEAKKLIVEFQRKLNQLLSSGPQNQLDEVYHLGISLYPVSFTHSKEKGVRPK